MKLFSVIIPTLQRSTALRGLVEMYATHPRVGEVLIVNNAPHPLTPLSPNVRVLQQETNIFVNQAWNVGAREARGAYLCISNDDIDFDPRLIDYAGMVLDRGKFSLVGPAPSCLNGRDGRLRHRLSLGPVRPYGTVMFMDAATYEPIPDGPLIWGGDDWLFWNRSRPAAEVRGVAIRTQMSTSAGKFAEGSIRQQDADWWLALADRGITSSQPWHARVARAMKVKKLRERVARKARRMASRALHRAAGRRPKR